MSMYLTDHVRLDFATRTKKNLEIVEQYNPENYATQLINSLLGMLVFIQETYLMEDRWRESLQEYVRTGEYTWKIYKIKNNRRRGRPPQKSMGRIIKHMRNALAHCGVEAISSEEMKDGKYEIVGFRFIDKRRNGLPFFGMEFDLNLIRKIAEDLIIQVTPTEPEVGTSPEHRR